jgi:hypothetical protein
MTDEKKAASPGASLSPYELVFGSAIFEADRFPGIREESESRGIAAEVPERFLLLGTVGALLQELLPEGAGSEEFSRHGALLYQAYHFWRYGKRHFQVSEDEARALVKRAPDSAGWNLVPPVRAGYFRLPRNLFWARIEEGATPEPVDGFFWTVASSVGGAEPKLERLELLLTLGLFPGRPGFSTIALETPLERTDTFPRSGARPEGEDFANILPGGELQGWYGLITELEVLKLVSLSFGELAGGGGDER